MANQLKFTGIACEGQTFLFDCPQGYFISITSGFYGRQDTERCLDENQNSTVTLDTQCSVSDAKNRIKAKCGSHNDCELPVTEDVFGDPCPGTSKYMEVAFVCLGG